MPGMVSWSTGLGKINVEGSGEERRGLRTFLSRAARKVPARLRAGPVAQAPDNGSDWQ